MTMNHNTHIGQYGIEHRGHYAVSGNRATFKDFLIALRDAAVFCITGAIFIMVAYAFSI